MGGKSSYMKIPEPDPCSGEILRQSNAFRLKACQTSQA
jgi:hypothetical protein